MTDTEPGTPGASTAELVALARSRHLDDVIGDAVGTLMATIAPHLPPIHWFASPGTGLHLELSGGAPDGDRDALERWAAALGLQPDDQVSPGYQAFRGDIKIGKRSCGTYSVHLFCVVDRAAFEGSMFESTAPCTVTEVAADTAEPLGQPTR